MSYDKAIKEFRIYEKTDHYFIFKLWYFSPMLFVNERDIVDKRVHFDKDGVHYSIATSLESHDQAPVNSSALRVQTFVNSTILSEDEDNFYFNCFTQIDAKMAIPETILNFTIPSKSTEWYKNYIKKIKELLSSS
jgi:hypothetical protein